MFLLMVMADLNNLFLLLPSHEVEGGLGHSFELGLDIIPSRKFGSGSNMGKVYHQLRQYSASPSESAASGSTPRGVAVIFTVLLPCSFFS